MQPNGVIYYNTGTRCLVRLLVSVYSLRRYYQGPIRILSWGVQSHPISRLIARATNSKVIEIEPKMAPCKYPHYMAKTKFHEFSPFVNTLYLDSDTLVVNPIDELFNIIEEHKMLVTSMFGRTSSSRVIKSRIKSWTKYYPTLIEDAINYGSAINCGVFGFNRDATIPPIWYKTAIVNPDYLMPDELTLQLLLPHHKHIVLDHKWNFISKRGDPHDPTIKILHYQSRKHCKPQSRWLPVYKEVAMQNLANIKAWQPAGDRTLRGHLAT